ncbi:MAG: hypothetical protein E7523_04700 [Ruminococcaceae bacterium]|nr:hypothetical protein [Oscillospiraceae bacterium]
MARINVGENCVIEADFVLRNRRLTQGQRVIFRAVVATNQGSVLLEHSMSPDSPNTYVDGHATIYCDLRDLDILPGIYTWELLLQDEDGALHCLMPASDNVLCVYAATTEV